MSKHFHKRKRYLRRIVSFKDGNFQNQLNFRVTKTNCISEKQISIENLKRNPITVIETNFIFSIPQ